VLILNFTAPVRKKNAYRSLFISIGSVYLAFNLFYFSNVIPPIPLALKEGGIYGFVGRTEDGGYIAREQTGYFLILKKLNKTFYWMPGTPVYCFSSVFAPTKINTRIYHNWMFYDDKTERWILADSLGFAINGGRDGGYRGYTFKTQVHPGKWRVDIVTERGQVLGRIKFDIVKTESPPKYEERPL